MLLGDSAYSLTDTMIIPYTNPNQQQRAFNYLHSATRVVVENAFGIFKGKWKIAGTTIRIKNSVEDYINPLKAAIVLHNICIEEGLPDLDPMIIEIDELVVGHNTRNDTGDGYEQREHMRLYYE